MCIHGTKGMVINLNPICKMPKRNIEKVKKDD